MVYNSITRNSGIGLRIQQSSGVCIYVNSFVENLIQVRDDGAYMYDDGFIGNYWSNYTGIDNDGDGIGDTPHEIDSDSEDAFPLIKEPAAPNIIDVEIEPRTPAYNETVKITIMIADYMNTDRVILRYHNGTEWNIINATFNNSTNIFEAEIQPLPPSITVELKIYARSTNKTWNATPIYKYRIVDPYPPEIIEIKQKPETVLENTSVKILANITDASEISTAILSYYNGDTWSNETMTYNRTSGYYEAIIPSMPAGTNVKYRVYCNDTYNNWCVSETYNYTVKAITTTNETATTPKPTAPDITLPLIVAGGAGAVAALVLLARKKKIFKGYS